MALTERLALLISLDAKQAVRGLEGVGRAADRNLGRAESKIDRTAQRMQKAGVGMLGAATLAATGLYKAGQSAADLEQAIGGTEAVFKDTSGVIDKFAKNSAEKMGLSERAFREATTSFGGQLKGLGFNIEDAADLSVDLTRKAADLAATYGGTTAEAVQALGAAFRGEADPAERFNLFLNQNRVNAKAVELGLAATTSQVDANAKAQATLALITEQGADAWGQFGREAGSASGQMQIANAELENAKASLGQSVAPIIADVAGGLSKLAGGFQKANAASGGLLSKLATFGTIGLGAAGGVSFVVGKLIQMRDTLAPLGGRLRDTEGGLTRMGRAAAGLGLAGFAVGVVALGRELDGLKVSVGDVTGAFSEMTQAEQDQTLEMLRLAEAAGGLDDLVSAVADASVPAAERLLEFAEANGIGADQVAELRDIIEQKRDSDVQGAKDQAAYAAEVDNAADATGGLTDKLNEQEEALQGVLDATLAMFDSNIAYRQSVDDVESAIGDVNTALKEHGENSEEYRDALLDAESALLDQAAASVRLYEDTLKASGGTLDANGKTQIYREGLIKLRDSLKPGSPLIAALQGYIDKLNTIPRQITTGVTVIGFQSRFHAPNSGPFAQLASGGAATAGDTYLVGEHGPELLRMGARNGYVASNGSLGGSTTIVIPVSIDGRELDRYVVDANARTVRRGYAA